MNCKWFQRLSSISEHTVKLLLIAVEVLLLLLSIMRTSVVSDYEEVTTYLIDKPFLHIGVLLAVAVLIALVRYFIKDSLSETFLKWTCWILFGLNLIFSLYLIYNTQFQPLGDSSILWKIACNMNNDYYWDFYYLGYAERHFNQMGALFFLKSLVKIAGDENQFILQVINVFALGILFLSLRSIAKKLFGRKTADATMILCTIFLPLSLYVVFTYFNLISWALIALGVQQEISYFSSGRKRNIVGMVIAMFFAILLKSFSWIAFIAMVIYACFEGFRKKKILPLCGLVGTALLILIANTAMTQKVLSKTGATELRTMPAIGYVAMGMQESYMAPGWYNGVHDRTYMELEGHEILMKEAFSEMIQMRIKEFKADSGYMALFYYQKTASQWNNPSFQGFWFGEISTPEVPVPEWIQSLYTGNIRNRLNSFLNYLLTVIHAGILLWLILSYKEIRLKHLLFGIYFLGGFIFLLLWEAKCQYALGFFLFMIPYAASGYKALYGKINCLFHKYNMLK